VPRRGRGGLSCQTRCGNSRVEDTGGIEQEDRFFFRSSADACDELSTTLSLQQGTCSNYWMKSSTLKARAQIQFAIVASNL
jgi:hypothetical protein